MSTQDRNEAMELPPLDAAPGPAKRIPSARAAEIVDGALDRAFDRRRRRTRLWRIAASVALVSSVAGTTAAAVYFGVLRRPEPPPARRTTPRTQMTAPGAPTAVPEVAPQAAAPALDTSPQDAAAPSPRFHESRDLLLLANRLRAEHRWTEAERLYRRAARFAGSDEADAASIAAASIRLEHLGDASGALSLFRAALAARPEGALAEEARWGVAQSLRALGDREAETRALREFLALYPRSLTRPQAETRLREIEPAVPPEH